LKKTFHAGILFVLAALFCGCASTSITNPPRSATEQLLLSTSADRALASTDLTPFAGQKFFLDTTYFDSYDSKYAEGEIRDAFSRAGALPVSAAKSADVIVEARSGGLSIDYMESLIGVPHIAIPIPLTGTFEMPEIAFYKTEKQFSYAKIALLAYANQSRAHVYSSGPLLGRAYNNYHKILFISWVFTDIPEKQKKPEVAIKYQKWFPQYDLTNMPPRSSTTNAPLANAHS
jgi:uncharacterized protein DUF6655